MKRCALGQATNVPSTGLGSSCSVVLNQAANDVGGWRIELYASFAETASALVGSVTVTTVTASRAGTRVAMVTSIPGAISYSATVTPGAGSTVPISVGLFQSTSTATTPATVAP